MDSATLHHTDPQTADYRQMLKRAFVQRREKNPAYSLRSFARDLLVSPSMLSEVMNYKKSLSHKSALRINESLKLSKTDAELFFLAVDLEHQNPLQTQADVRTKMDECTSVGKVLTLNDDRFKIISDFRHYVVLALFGVQNFKYNLPWIAGLIGGFQFQVKEIFKRLQRVGVLKFNDRNEPELIQDFVHSADGLPSEVVRSYHRSTLQHATECLDSIPVAERDYHSLIFAIDQSDLSHIQSDVREFHRNLYLKYGRKPTANRVYGIQSQFVPYSNRSGR